MKKIMTQELIELLQALNKVIAIEPNLLDHLAYNRYNELVDLAKKENILW